MVYFSVPSWQEMICSVQCNLITRSSDLCNNHQRLALLIPVGLSRFEHLLFKVNTNLQLTITNKKAAAIATATANMKLILNALAHYTKKSHVYHYIHQNAPVLLFCALFLCSHHKQER